MKRGKYNVLIGGQAGSESKGKLSAWLVQKYQPQVITMTASPNAGHSLVVGDCKLVTYHLPVGMGMSQPGTTILLGPASVINPSILAKEVRELSNWGFDGTIIIDPRATIITPAMISGEGSLTKIGSTAQGVGMARIARINRVDVIRMSDIWDDLHMGGGSVSVLMGDTVGTVHDALSGGHTVLHESTQGADLCLDHGLDPVYCTTRNITTAGALAEFGVPPQMVGDVYGVVRTFPIRVNNRDGSSGPYPGSKELNWEQVGKNCGAPHDITEKTTTTKLVRRVFSFNWDRYIRFLNTCGPNHICLQFANYLDWAAYGVRDWSKLPHTVTNFVYELRRRSPGVAVDFIGTGPDHADMVDVEEPYCG